MQFKATVLSLAALAVAAPQNSGSSAGCPAPSANDTPSNFESNPTYAAAANANAVLANYTTVFVNKQAAVSGAGDYLGYTQLQTYAPSQCATACAGIKGCQAFDIYFERDPSVNPTDSCTNPASEVNIVCAYWSGPMLASEATNAGQWKESFNVVIAGANGFALNASNGSAVSSSAVPASASSTASSSAAPATTSKAVAPTSILPSSILSSVISSVLPSSTLNTVVSSKTSSAVSSAKTTSSSAPAKTSSAVVSTTSANAPGFTFGFPFGSIGFGF